MAIFNPVMWTFREILAIDGLVTSPFLSLGVQDIEQGDHIPADFKFATLSDLLRARGVARIDEIDPFDPRATLDWNLNYPVPNDRHESYGTVFDIGTSEHVFDTRQAIESCMRLVRVGGHYAVHVPVRNFADHGLHTYSSELMPRAMEANGFEVVYRKMTTSGGTVVTDSANVDVIGWTVGRKLRSLGSFVCPEQTRYAP